MLKTRMKRLASQSETAQQRLAEIEAVITALGNEDLLDFADIFTANPGGPLRDIAAAEMARRNISLATPDAS
jgi:hypothetical protein